MTSRQQGGKRMQMSGDEFHHTQVHELRFAGQLLLWSLRQLRYGADAQLRQDLVTEALGRVGLGRAPQTLVSLLSCFDGEGRGRLLLLPPDRLWLSGDELNLLNAVGAVQSNQEAPSIFAWSERLGPTGARLAVASITELAAQFRHAGLLVGLSCTCGIESCQPATERLH